MRKRASCFLPTLLAIFVHMDMVVVTINLCGCIIIIFFSLQENTYSFSLYVLFGKVGANFSKDDNSYLCVRMLKYE